MVRLQPLSRSRKPAYQAQAAPPVTREALQQSGESRPAYRAMSTAPVTLEALQKPKGPQEKPRPLKPPIEQPVALEAQPALRENPTKNQNQQPGTQAVKMIAPVKGWYTAASIAEAPQGTALIIENWFCEPDAVRIRRGQQPYATGLGGVGDVIETLALYTSGDTEEMWAVCDGDLFDVSLPGAVGAAVLTGLTNSRWQYVNFANTAGAWLLMVNGQDDLLRYNGTTWDTTSDINEEDGVTPLTNLTNIWIYKERLWFTKAGSTDLWYLPVDAISGTCEKVTCGSLLPRGGSMIAGINWSVSDESGKEDFLVAISSEGEVLVFAGDDPSDATAWGFFGSYYVGSPIGSRCLTKAGGDVLIISRDGVLPLSQVIMLDRATFLTAAKTKNIAPTFAEMVRLYGDNFGWEIATFPLANMALLNVPTIESVDAEQIVWHTATGGMSKFTGWRACCWALYQDELYFGGPIGIVHKAETGAQDGDEGITAYLLPAYDDLGSPAFLKHVKLIKPIYESNVFAPPEISVAVDYQDPSTWAALPAVEGEFFTWDASLWDEDVWLGTQTYRAWQSGMNIGSAISPAVRVTVEAGGEANDLSYRLFAHHILFEKGGIVG